MFVQRPRCFFFLSHCLHGFHRGRISGLGKTTTRTENQISMFMQRYRKITCFFPRKLVFIFVYICACHTRFIPVSDLFFTETHLCVVNRRQWIINRLISSCNFSNFYRGIARDISLYLSSLCLLLTRLFLSFTRLLFLSLFFLSGEKVLSIGNPTCVRKKAISFAKQSSR